METTMLSIKYVMFLAMEVFIFIVMAGALIAGLYQVIRDRVRESRRLGEAAPVTPPATSTASTAIRQS